MSALRPFSAAAPCRHRGAPTEQLIDHLVQLLSKSLPKDSEYLAKNGLTSEEYVRALPTAIQKLRGSMAASTGNRRDFVSDVVSLLVETGAIDRFETPKYGKDTVYRLFLRGGIQVGLIQKGCPDGNHSSVTWSRPEWADELYLWWVCDSKAMEPGEHIWKGVNRLRRKVSAPGEDQLDGLIFYNHLCGSADRPCPKIKYSVMRNGSLLPPPCIYVLPHWKSESYLNWRGETTREFPIKLLHAFAINESTAKNFIGYAPFPRFIGPYSVVLHS